MSALTNPHGRCCGPTTRRLLLALAVTQLAACNTWQGMTAREEVQPWQRGILAQDNMQIPHDKMQKYTDDHIYFSREASTGGNSVGGGGCGCN